jgi:hypothetical protein
MKLQVVRTARTLAIPRWAVAVAGLWLCLAAVATWASARVGLDAPLCSLRLLAHVPCPFCGTGRAGLCALQGHLLDAWRLNPLVVTVAAIAAVLLIGRLVLARRVQVDLTARERRAAWAAAAALLALNWLYVLVCVG